MLVEEERQVSFQINVGTRREAIFFPDVQVLNPITQAWIKFSDKNIEDSNSARQGHPHHSFWRLYKEKYVSYHPQPPHLEKPRVKSGDLRGAVSGLLSSACTELMTAWSVCNRCQLHILPSVKIDYFKITVIEWMLRSFKERIQETEEAHGLLNNHLQTNVQVTQREMC